MIIIIDDPYGCISLFIKHHMKMRTRLPKVGMSRGTFFSIKGILKGYVPFLPNGI